MLLVLFFQPIKNLEVIGFSFPWSSKEGAGGDLCGAERKWTPSPRAERSRQEQLKKEAGMGSGALTSVLLGQQTWQKQL